MLSVPEVLDLLVNGRRLVGLPTMSGSGIHMVYAEDHFHWFTLDQSGGAATGYERLTRQAAHDFLSPYQRGGGYASELVKRWRKDSNGPEPDVLKRALARTSTLFDRLKADAGLSICVMETYWLWHNPWMGWIFGGLGRDGDPTHFQGDDSRAGSEVLSALIKDPGCRLATPPEPVRNHQEDFERRAATLFEAHGPTQSRALWIERDGDTRQGYVLDAQGFFVEIDIEGDGQSLALTSRTKVPTDRARKALFSHFDKDRLTLGSTDLAEAVCDQIAGSGKLEALQGWLAEGVVTIECGERRPGEWIPDSPTSMLHTYKGDIEPIEAILPAFLDREGWCRVRFEPFVPLSEIARAEDDPAAPSVRYTIPKGWAYRFDRESLIEAALTAVFKTATDYDGPLVRTETRDAHEHREPSITVKFAAKDALMTVHRSPIEGAYGVHGEYISVSFGGLPDGVEVAASAKLDMRSGGHIHLDFRAAPEVSAALKRGCLSVLP